MGIGKAIGEKVHERRKQKVQSNLEDRLDSFDVTDEAIEELDPYIEYIADNRGGASKTLAGVLLGVVGIAGLAFGLLAGGLPEIIRLMFVGFAAVFLGIPAWTYRKMRKAKAVERALLTNPEKFVNDEPHPYHDIKDSYS